MLLSYRTVFVVVAVVWRFTSGTAADSYSIEKAGGVLDQSNSLPPGWSASKEKRQADFDEILDGLETSISNGNVDLILLGELKGKLAEMYSINQMTVIGQLPDWLIPYIADYLMELAPKVGSGYLEELLRVLSDVKTDEVADFIYGHFERAAVSTRREASPFHVGWWGTGLSKIAEAVAINNNPESMRKYKERLEAATGKEKENLIWGLGASRDYDIFEYLLHLRSVDPDFRKEIEEALATQAAGFLRTSDAMLSDGGYGNFFSQESRVEEVERLKNAAERASLELEKLEISLEFPLSAYARSL